MRSRQPSISEHSAAARSLGRALTPVLRVAGAALLALPLVGWQGSGKGGLTYARGGTTAEGSAVMEGLAVAAPFDAIGTMLEGHTRAVLVVDLPGGSGDGVLTIDSPLDGPTYGDVPVPSEIADMVYEEYGGDGDSVFFSTAPVGLYAAEFANDGDVTLRLDLRFSDAAGDFRQLTGARVRLHGQAPVPDTGDTPAAAPAGGSATASNGGCEDDAYDGSDSTDSSWDSSTDDSGGCDGSSDTTGDTGESTDTGASGCEGDDVETDTTDEADSSGCEGDAAAALSFDPPGHKAGQRARRSPALAKLVSWLPYLWVLVPLGLRNRRLARVFKFR